MPCGRAQAPDGRRHTRAYCIYANIAICGKYPEKFLKKFHFHAIFCARRVSWGTCASCVVASIGRGRTQNHIEDVAYVKPQGKRAAHAWGNDGASKVRTSETCCKTPMAKRLCCCDIRCRIYGTSSMCDFSNLILYPGHVLRTYPGVSHTPHLRCGEYVPPPFSVKNVWPGD